MTRLPRLAVQRWAPKHPHKPASQALGPRMLHRQHWRKADSLDRQQRRETRANRAAVPLFRSAANTFEMIALPTAVGLPQVRAMNKGAV
jgi:hypothetical protein